ncbi:MAG: DUF881 domain-containing protein [Nocardioidaceae bacterium]
MPEPVHDATPEPTEPEAGPAPGEKVESGRARLLRALGHKPGRGQLLIAVLLAALGFAAAVQIHLTHTSNDFGGQRRQNLVELLDSLSGASDRAQSQIAQLQQTKLALQSSSHRQSAAIADTERKLGVLGVLAGTVGATGPGVVITIDDPQAAVTAASMLDGVEELRDAGAEAIEINDRVRVVASTSFTETSDVVSVDGIPVHPPYVIDAIGSPHTLSQAVVFPGGLSDQVESLGGTVDVQELDKVVVASLHKVKPPQYSQPISH